MRKKYEKVQKGNKCRLTEQQHVWPKRSIKRFLNAGGRVEVFDKYTRKQRFAAPSDWIFCAKRVWDQRAETGYMKRIEDSFQKLADGVLSGAVTAIGPEQKRVVDDFYALWRLRAQARTVPEGELKAASPLVTGTVLSKDQEERLESNGYLFVRAGGRVPLRQIIGMQIERQIFHMRTQQLADVQWGLISPLEGNFLVPDYPHALVIPLTPTLAICNGSGGQNVSITRENLAQINEHARVASLYYFAKDLAQCP